DHGAERTRIAVSLSTASPGGLSPVRRIIEVPTTGGGIIQRVATEVATMIGITRVKTTEKGHAMESTVRHDAEEAYLRGRGYLEPGSTELQSAVAAFRRAIHVDKQYAPAHASLAEAYLQQYEATKDPTFIALASAQSEEALELQPSLAYSHVVRGRVYRVTAQNERAIREFTEALRLNDDAVDARMMLATVYEAEGLIQDAEGMYEKVIARHPQYWAAYE